MSLDRCEGTWDLFNRSVPQIAVDLSFQTMNLDRASQENFPRVKVMGNKDLCPRQGLVFQHRVQIQGFLSPRAAFSFRGVTLILDLLKRSLTVFLWRHWHVVGRKARLVRVWRWSRISSAQSQGQGQGHLPDPFCPVNSSTKTNHQQSQPCLQPHRILLQRPWGVSQGFCNGLCQITVWKEV